eukprot:4120898-Amphidinium_carterae.1
MLDTAKCLGMELYGSRECDSVVSFHLLKLLSKLNTFLTYASAHKREQSKDLVQIRIAKMCSNQQEDYQTDRKQ